MLSKFAVIRFQVEGWHQWPSAPAHRDYLGASHRHLFHVKASVQVFDNDREIEFHDLLDECKTQFTGGDMGARSCEDMACDLLEYLRGQYEGRQIKVSVFEDGENGAVVEYLPND